MDDKQVFYVENAEDGRRFKMVIRGDLRKLSVAKIRRYLSSFGMGEEDHALRCHGVQLTNDMVGRDFNLVPDAVISLHPPLFSPSGEDGGSSSSQHSHASQPHPSSSHAAAGARRAASPEHRAAPLFGDSVPSLDGGAAALVAENQKLKAELERLRREALNLNSPGAAVVMAAAQRNLRALAASLETTLSWSAQLECQLVVTPQTCLHLRLDVGAERILLAAVVRDTLPADYETRAQLYEILLEGSLFGKTCGGGALGVSLEQEEVVLCASLFIKHAEDSMLSEAVPVFLSALRQWRSLLRELY